MATVTKPIALDESFNTTEVTPRNIADVLAEGLSHITGRTASEVEYDNTDSGLTADNVQDALDEIAESIPTLPSVDIQTAVDEFETYNGGLLSECKVALSPNQDLHGYDSPWVGGAGKNLFQTTASSGSNNGKTFTINSDGSVTINGVADVNTAYRKLGEQILPAGTYILSTGSPSNNYYIDYSFSISGTKRVIVSEISITLTQSETVSAWANALASSTPNDVNIYPMIRISGDSSWNPYENICPISGHTQVEVDVSDGDTTQEQVTVNLGGTYYSGTLDVVTGVFTPDTAFKTFDGSEGWSANGTTGYLITRGASGMSDVKLASSANTYCLSNLIPRSGVTWADKSIGIENGTVWIGDVDNAVFGDLAGFKTFLSNTNLQLEYELATPTPIQLSPTMVKAIVGENHLSAPLEGQDITESKYKQAFTFDDVIAYIQSLS